MRICPQCSAKYGDDLNFCKNCSTMLQTVGEAPPPATEPPALTAMAEIPEPVPAEPKQAVRPQKPPMQCTRCGSSKIIPNTTIRDRCESSGEQLSAYVDAAPDALIFKERLYSALVGDICGECGHVELKAEDHRSLYRHYLQSKSKSV
jgi:hypothetical protein